MTSEVFAPAKINLALHVTGQRADGYHLLDSLVVFADVGDRLWLEPGPALTVEVQGPFAAGVPTDRRNLIWQAGELAGFTGKITLEKNLPHGAGIGGGSADAAALLRHCGFAGDSSVLGADVPVCLAGQATRMRGVGEVLTPLPDLPALPAVLVNPGVPMATPPVFKALQQKQNPGLPVTLPKFSGAADLIDWLGAQRNDLQGPAISIAPAISAVLTALEAQPQVRLCRMSGSGSTCFALLDDAAAARALAARLGAAHPGWWVRACQLGGTAFS